MANAKDKDHLKAKARDVEPEPEPEPEPGPQPEAVAAPEPAPDHTMSPAGRLTPANAEQAEGKRRLEGGIVDEPAAEAATKETGGRDG